MEALTLTDRETEIAALHFVDEVPQALIAERLSVSLRTVETLIYRATKKYPVLRTVRQRNQRRPRVTPFSNVGRAEGFTLD
jgi:DNA-directed RNA polymerase specialized sigma24 family protein